MLLPSVAAALLLPLMLLSPQPRAIIFILSDDLGFGDVSIASPVQRTPPLHRPIPTPNVQRLADNGLTFTRAYSGQVCAPSRCSLMLGLHSGHCTVRGNDGSYCPLLQSDTTVAAALQRAGWGTALFGKWGLGDYGSAGYPLAQGFDTFVGQDSQCSTINARRSACLRLYPHCPFNDGALLRLC